MRILLVIQLSLLLASTLLSLNAAPRATIESGPHFVGDSVNLSIVIAGTREAHQVDLAPLSHLEARILEAAPLPASAAEPAFLIRIRILATQTGNFAIPPLRVWGPEGIWQTDPLTFQVGLPTASEEIRLHQSSESRQVYVGEPFVVEVEWQFDSAITAIHAVDLRLPWFTQAGLKVHEPRTLSPLPGNDIGLPVSGTRVIAKVEGRSIRFQRIIVANEAGTMTLAPATLLASRSTRPERAGRGGIFQYPAYFDNQFFNAPAQGHFERIFTRSEPITIEVLPLPEAGQPASFTGIVGAFNLSASVQPDRGFVGSPLQLEVRVLDYAFPEILDLPKLADLPGFSGRFNLPPDRGLPGLESTDQGWVRTFRQSIRPLSTGVEFVPAIEISYFNPISGSYESTSSLRLPLRIDSARMASIFDATLDDGSHLQNRLKASENGFGALFRSDELQLLTAVRTPLNNAHYWTLAVSLPIVLTLLALSASHRLRLSYRYPAAARAYYATHDFRRALRRTSDQQQRLVALKAFFAARLNRSVRAITPGSIHRDLHAAHIAPTRFTHSLKALEVSEEIHFDTSAASAPAIDWKIIEKELVREGHTPELASHRRLLARLSDRQYLPVWLTVSILLGVWGLSTLLSQPINASNLPNEAIEQAEHFFLSGLERQLDEPAEAHADFERAAALYELALEYSHLPGQRARLHYNAASARFFAGEKGRSLAHLLTARALLPEDSTIRRAIDHIRTERIDRIPLSWHEQMLSSPLSIAQNFSQTSQRMVLTLLLVAICLLVFLYTFYSLRAIRIAALAGMTIGLLLAFLLAWEHALLNAQDSGVIVAEETIARQGNGLLYPRALESPLHDAFEFRWLEQRGEWLAIDPGGKMPVVWIPAESAQF
jgi:hypothetical protein